MHNISGIVPKQNRNIDNAPCIKEPVPSAYTCIAPSGPHGINPLKSPIIKELFDSMLSKIS